MGRPRSVERVGVLKINHPKVVNLSSKILTEPQVSLLLKGLKFTPTPRSNQIELKTDIKEFCRKLRLAEFFHKENESEQVQTRDKSLVKDKSNFYPPKNRNHTLDSVSQYLEQQELAPKIGKPKSNVNKLEWDALKGLQNDATIIIKEADKGGSTVIMNKSHYEKMVNIMLQDVETYEKVSNDIDRNVMKHYLELIETHKSSLTKDEYIYLTKFRPKTSLFYGLPKIHKSKIINEAIEVQNAEYIKSLEPIDLELRPIVAGFLCPTRRLSNLTDILLKPFLIKVESYIRDDIDFLSKCNRNVNGHTILTSFDIKSLYTSIPHDLGLEAIAYWLDTYPELLHPRFAKTFVLKGLEFVLTNNNFLFNNECFHQRQGTAMGTIAAPTYATLVVGYLEIQFYDKIKCSYGEDAMRYIMNNWDRFLDDCFSTLDCNIITPEQLSDILNDLHPKIKFTMENSSDHLPFLDINILKTENELSMDIYFKPTDTRRCLPFHSCHPKHTRNSIPYTLARRICTIVENNELKQKRLKELKEILESQKYPNDLIDVGIFKALNIPQTELRTTKEKKKEKSLAFISTYNPNNQNIFPKIKEAFNTLQEASSTKNIFSNYKLIRSLRQPPSLKRLLTKAEYSSERNGVFKCNKPRCKCCKYIEEGDKHTFKTTNKTFHIKSHFTCESSNLIYVIICQNCYHEYIGETGEGTTILRDRTRVYVQHINNPCYQMLKVEEHIRTCGKGQFKIKPFFQLKKNDKYLRQQYELYFRSIFKPSLH